MYTKKISLFSLFILIVSAIYFSIGSLAGSHANEITPESPEFKSYWYSGKAEITSYKLEQARYGELHTGYSVFVFVTEDFSKEKQVKLDHPSQAKDDKVRVMKLNKIKKFDTGIYRYSIMDSVFTPINLTEYPNTLKVSSSSQEWCGNTFTQLNLGEGGFDIQSFSYFESEGDSMNKLDNEFLEDEIFTRIKINPDTLPIGNIKIIPSAVWSRFSHQELSVQDAKAELARNSEDPASLRDYKLTYSASGRVLTVTFNKDFPYEIVSWEETSKSGFGEGARELTTKATIDKTLVTDYWNKNKPMDRVLREELGI